MSAPVTFTLPGKVWGDCLDPDCSTMQAELGLPEPTVTRRGRGYRYTYTDVPHEIADDLRLFLWDVVSMRAGGEDYEGAGYAARKAAEALGEVLGVEA